MWRLRNTHLAIILLLLANAFTWTRALSPSGSDLTVVFVDVGQGDCTLILTPGGRTIMIDGGGRHGDLEASMAVGRQVVEPLLLHYGVNRIDLLVSTHPDEDHIGGLIPVAQHMKIGEVIDCEGPGTPEPDLERRFVAACRERGIHRREISDGTHIDLGDGVTMDALNPPAPSLIGTANDDNNDSIVLRLTYGEREFIFAGDAESEAEEAMLRAHPLIRSDVLKVGHHGSKNASSWPWLRAVHPEAAVISCGRKNPYGHPARDVLNRLWTVGADVYRTDVHGAIVVTTNGHNLHITPTRPLPAEQP